MTHANTKELKGRHVLFYLLAFFGLMFAVNGVFLYAAIDTFPGEDTEKSYLQGLNYNSTLAQRKAQQALGWEGSIGLRGSELVLEMADADDRPLSGHDVRAVLRRPATTSADIALNLIARGSGRYGADVGVLEKGRWEVVVTLSAPGSAETLFVAEKVLIVS